jgi:hypothetical protein
MDFKFLFHSVNYIFRNPIKAWEEIYSENKPAKYIGINLLLPLIILAAISAFLGSFLFTRTELSKTYSFLAGVKYFILIYLVICGTTFILREITNALGLGKDSNLSFKLVAYSSIPLIICQIVSKLFESFVFINVLALFGLYIFWTGMEKLLKPPEQRKIPLLIAATVTFIVVFFTVNWLLSILTDKLYFVFFA